MFSVLVILCSVLSSTVGMRTHFVYWNSTNPMFRLESLEPVLEVNQGNFPSQPDQLHLICPSDGEQHVIYSVSEDEFRSCRVSSPRPKIVAVCDQPDRFRYFTITFRSFSPNPTALEFNPGQNYYLISTSTPLDLHRRAGGYCSTHNMKMTIKVAENGATKAAEESLVPPSTSTTTSSPLYRAITSPKYTTTSNSIPVYYYRSKTPAIHSSDYIYYYSPRDLVQLKLKAKKHDRSINVENETYRAQRLTSSASSYTLSLLAVLFPVVYLALV